MVNPTPGKAITVAYPSPNLSDRIIAVKKQVTGPEYSLPASGAALPSDSNFLFCTATVDPRNEQAIWYYVNERSNQDAHNYQIEYPYEDSSYPRLTRTYVTLRSTAAPVAALASDPYYDGTGGKAHLKLVNQKLVKIGDEILDALFVGVQRVYEKVPGPAVTSAMTGTEVRIPPELLDIVSMWVSRRNPVDLDTTDPSPPHIETDTDNVSVGIIQSSIKATGTDTGEKTDLYVSWDQDETASGKSMETQYGGTVAEVYVQLVEEGATPPSGEQYYASKVTPIGGGLALLTYTRRASAESQWPILVDYDVDDRTGLLIRITRQVFDTTLAGTAGYVPGLSGNVETEHQALDRWRTIQIVSKFDTDAVASWSRSYSRTISLSLPPLLRTMAIRSLGFDAYWTSLVGSGGESGEDHRADLGVEYDMFDPGNGPWVSTVYESMSTAPVNVSYPLGVVLKPESYNFTIKFFPQTTRNGSRWSATPTVIVYRIPESIHGSISPTIEGGIHGTIMASSRSIPATSPAQFSGNIITIFDPQYYRFGYWLCSYSTTNLSQVGA